MATPKKKGSGGAAHFLARCEEERREIEKVCLARLRELTVAQEAATQRGDEEEAARLEAEMTETEMRMYEPTPLWKAPIRARDESFEAMLQLFATGKFARAEPYHDPSLDGTGTPSRFANAVRWVLLTPDEIQAEPEPQWRGYSQTTLDILERVRMMKPANAFQFGFTVGLLAGEAQASEYAPESHRADQKKSRLAHEERRPIRSLVLKIAEEEKIATPGELRALLNCYHALGVKCEGKARDGWTFTERRPRPTKAPEEWKIGQTQLAKLLKGNAPA